MTIRKSIGDENRKTNYDPNLLEKVFADAKKIQERRKNQPPKVETPTETETQTETSTEKPARIITSGDYWTIGDVELYKQMLPVQTQEAHIKDRIQAQKTNGFYAESMPFMHNKIFKPVYLAKDTNPEAEEIRQFVQEKCRSTYPMTLTRILNKAKSKRKNIKDIIIHNIGIGNAYEYSEELNFIGPDELVKDSKTPKVYKALLGSDNLQEIDEIYQWLNQTPAQLYRINSRPDNDLETLARFYFDSVGAYLSCCGDLQNAVSAFGVRARRAPTQKFSGGNKT